MRVTSKGQVTIPIEFRNRLGFVPGTQVDFRVRGDELVIVKRKGDLSRGWKIVERIRGTAMKGMTTEETMALTRGRD